MLVFIGSTIFTNLPPAMVNFSRKYLMQVMQGRARYGLHISVLILLACAVVTWFILNRTMLGRGIYAVGGDPVAAERAGFNTRALPYFIYAFSGAIAGIAGIVHSSMFALCHAFRFGGDGAYGHRRRCAGWCAHYRGQGHGDGRCSVHCS